MPSNYIIKANAKTSLENKWSGAISIGAIILSIFCLYVVFLQLILIPITAILNEFFTTVAVIVLTVVTAQLFGMPLLYGALRWFWFTSSDANVPISEIFCYFSNGKTLSFVLSFFGWFLLTFLYHPTLFTLPYFLASYSVFCRFLINHYNRRIATTLNNSF